MKLEASNLSMSFDDAGQLVKVFSDVELTLEPATSLAIVGNSGVGKTTLLNILGGLEKPVTGYSKLGQQDCFRGDTDPLFRAKNFGFVFQSHNLLSDFTALENVMMPLMILGSSLDDARKNASDLLSKVGLEQRKQHKTLLLSGGEQQRVAIARAMVTKPSVILADEPTGNLDKDNSDKIARLLSDAQEINNSSVVVVTHSMEFAQKMQRVLRLTKDGLQEI